MACFRHLLTVLAVAIGLAQSAVAADLPSWNDGPAKAAIQEFVAAVTASGGVDYVPEPERIAAFDNDGTLWVEQPIYTEGVFAFDRVKAQASQHPEWRERQPFKGVLENDLDAALATGTRGILELVMATHAGMTTDAFAAGVTAWLATARHPRFDRPYTRLIYQPMIELLEYLRTNGFKTFIVSGGGIDFMRPWTEGAYAVPPEQVVGSSGKTAFALKDGKPEIVNLPEVEFIDDGPGKPVGIHRFIGRSPIAAFGNSDGDLEMLQWTTMGPPGAASA